MVGGRVQVNIPFKYMILLCKVLADIQCPNPIFLNITSCRGVVSAPMYMYHNELLMHVYVEG